MLEEVRLQVSSDIPQWNDILIKTFGKYLGFLVGPGAQNREWDKIGKELLETAQMVKNLGLPKFHAMVMYQMFGISKVQFIAQLRCPPKKLHRLERSASRLVIGGPGMWTPTNMLSSLKSHCHFPSDIKDLRTLCQSIMLRSAFCTLDNWNSCFETACETKTDMESGLVHSFPEWWGVSFVVIFVVGML